MKLREDVNKDLENMFNNVKDELIEVMMLGARKHGAGSWKQLDNPSLQHKPNHASLFRHVAESFCEHTVDDESGQHPGTHIIVRTLMMLNRRENDD